MSRVRYSWTETGSLWARSGPYQPGGAFGSGGAYPGAGGFPAGGPYGAGSDRHPALDLRLVHLALGAREHDGRLVSTTVGKADDHGTKERIRGRLRLYAVTVEDEYPRVMFTRERHRRGVVYFGPYANAKKVRETLDVLNRAFQYRPCEGPKPGRHSGIPCLDYHIDRCHAPCVDYISRQDYRAIIDGVVEFPRSIEGVRMALLFREVSQGRVKVSLRSIGPGAQERCR